MAVTGERPVTARHTTGLVDAMADQAVEVAG
jgi:hypothetical protein